MERLIEEGKEIFRVIKTLRQDYTVDDFLKAIHKIKKLKRIPKMIEEYPILTEQEKRKHPRYAVDIAVELGLQSDSTKHLVVCYGCAKNISLGGIFVKMPSHKDVKYPKIKEKVKLRVRIPVLDIQEYLELNGQIIWHIQKEEDYNIGIQFISNDKEKEESLSKFVNTIR